MFHADSCVCGDQCIGVWSVVDIPAVPFQRFTHLKVRICISSVTTAEV